MSPPDPEGQGAIDAAVSLFDDVATEAAACHENIHLVSGAAISAQVGWSNAHDMRSYQRFRAPFTPAFLDALAAEAYYATRAFGSYFYKALVLDCDGTLWGGVLGEDHADGIKLDPFSYPGSMFWRIQHEFLALQRGGVLLCLCSKNDPAQVDEVLATHPAMVIRDEHVAAKRVNWDDKVESLESLAAELDIGLDSMIFVDDSTFECEAVRSRLPMVTTFQVPGDLSEYPDLIERMKRLFAVDRRRKTLRRRRSSIVSGPCHRTAPAVRDAGGVPGIARDAGDHPAQRNEPRPPGSPSSRRSRTSST